MRAGSGSDEVEVDAVLKIPGRQDVPQVVRLPRKAAERMGLVDSKGGRDAD